MAALIPALLLACAALFAFAHGSFWAALGLGVAAAIAWIVTPSTRRRRTRGGSGTRPRTNPTQDDAADAEARAILGVRMGAAETEIRAAYRSKMAQAHPDLGGSHAQAARLTAARDRLLRRR